MLLLITSKSRPPHQENILINQGRIAMLGGEKMQEWDLYENYAHYCAKKASARSCTVVKDGKKLYCI